MDKREAMLILSLKPPFTKGDLKKKHMKMMMINHPDKGIVRILKTKVALYILQIRSIKQKIILEITLSNQILFFNSKILFGYTYAYIDVKMIKMQFFMVFISFWIQRNN